MTRIKTTLDSLINPQTYQLAYLKTPLMSISNVAAFTRGMFGSILPRPTRTTHPPGLVTCNTTQTKGTELSTCKTY